MIQILMMTRTLNLFINHVLFMLGTFLRMIFINLIAFHYICA